MERAPLHLIVATDLCWQLTICGTRLQLCRFLMIGARALEPITKRPRLIWNQFRIKTDRDDDHSSLSLSLSLSYSFYPHSEIHQIILIYFIRKSITLRLTSYLTGLDLTWKVKLLFIQRKQSSWIQTNKTGGRTGDRPYNDTSPYYLSECSLVGYYRQCKQRILTRRYVVIRIVQIIPFPHLPI